MSITWNQLYTTNKLLMIKSECQLKRWSLLMHLSLSQLMSWSLWVMSREPSSLGGEACTCLYSSWSFNPRPQVPSPPQAQSPTAKLIAREKISDMVKSGYLKDKLWPVNEVVGILILNRFKLTPLMLSPCWFLDRSFLMQLFKFLWSTYVVLWVHNLNASFRHTYIYTNSLIDVIIVGSCIKNWRTLAGATILDSCALCTQVKQPCKRDMRTYQRGCVKWEERCTYCHSSTGTYISQILSAIHLILLHITEFLFAVNF